MCDAAEALWVDEIRERVLAERQVVASLMAMSEERDSDDLPDVDTALAKFYERLNGEIALDDLTPDDERRLAVGLGRKR